MVTNEPTQTLACCRTACTLRMLACISHNVQIYTKCANLDKMRKFTHVEIYTTYGNLHKMWKFTQNVEITQNCNFCVLCLNVETSQISTLRSLKNQSGFCDSSCSDNPSTYISGIYII